MKSVITAAIIALSSTVAFAGNSLPEKAAEDTPGVTGGGTTTTPTAQPADGSLSDKATKDQPTASGTTTNPTAQPNDSSLADKAAKDQGTPAGTANPPTGAGSQ